jgi:hypothetical protein
MVHSMLIMAEHLQPPRKPSRQDDEWGTTQRMGYEDRPVYQPRKTISQRKGSRPLRVVGSLIVIGAVVWSAYVATSMNGVSALLKTGPPAPPVVLLAVGLLILVLEKLIR